MGSVDITSLLGVHNIRDFGFISNPTANNAPAINSAIVAASIYGGGQVWLPGDVAIVGISSSVVLRDNVELVIPTGVTLKLLNGANCDVVKNADATNGNTGLAITGGGTIDGNKANNTSGTWSGVHFVKVSDPRIAGIQVKSCRVEGVLLTGCMRAHVDVIATDNGTDGIGLLDTVRSEIRARSYDNCKVAAAGTGDGISLDGASTDNVIISPICYDSAAGGAKRQGYGVRETIASTCDRNVISGGSLEGNRDGTYSLVGAASRVLVDNTPFPISGYTKVGLPAAGTAGRVARVTNDVRGAWMDMGSHWFSLSGEVANVKEFGAVGDGLADDTAAIQAAIDAVSNTGGAVLVPIGDHIITSTLTLKSNVKLLGMGWGSHIHDNTGNLIMLSINDSDGVVIEGLRLSGSGNLGVAGRAAIWIAIGAVYGGKKCRIINNFVIGVGTCGITVANATGCVVTGNYIESTKEHGIYLSESVDCSVYGNVIERAGEGSTSANVDGIKVASNSSKCVIANNIITAPLHEGILFDTGAGNCIAMGNVIRDCPERGIRLSAAVGGSILLESNTILNCTSQAIRVQAGAGHVVKGNVVVSPSDIPIYLVTPTDALVMGNYVMGTPAGGAAIDVGGSNHLIAENFINNSPQATYGVALAAGSSGISVMNNFNKAATKYVDNAGVNLISELLSATAAWDPASVADGAMTSTTLTVAGAAVGDTVTVGFSKAVPAGAILSGAVTAADTVTVTLFNKTGAPLDLAAGTLRADVRKH